MNKILLTLPSAAFADTNARLLPAEVLRRLEGLGEVIRNPHARPLTPGELCALLPGCTVCVTGWKTPPLDATALAVAPQLRFVAHIGGTVAPHVCPELYRRSVRVSSANRVLARAVAEGILAYILTALRDIPHFDRALHAGVAWPRDVARSRSLHDERIGFVGLGTTGRCLLDLLRPFAAPVKIFDPYVEPEALAAWPFAQLAPLDEVLASSTVLSIHAALTPETTGLLNRAKLQRLPIGALLVNTARGAIIDEPALIAELAAGRLRACLDVFAEEPLPTASPLRTLPNVVLGPHLAGAPSHGRLAAAMVGEIERFLACRPLEHEITFDHYSRMTCAVPPCTVPPDPG